MNAKIYKTKNTNARGYEMNHEMYKPYDKEQRTWSIVIYVVIAWALIMTGLGLAIIFGIVK